MCHKTKFIIIFICKTLNHYFSLSTKLNNFLFYLLTMSSAFCLVLICYCLFLFSVAFSLPASPNMPVRHPSYLRPGCHFSLEGTNAFKECCSDFAHFLARRANMERTGFGKERLGDIIMSDMKIKE